jgi:hypothetical protein
MNRSIACLALLASLAVHAAPLENKWRLQFSGNAESSGTIVIAIAPSEGDAVSVPVDIKDGTSENGVAKRVRDVLRDSVGERYKVERDDGEDVLVKRRFGEQRFNVSITSNTVKGVRVNLDQE